MITTIVFDIGNVLAHFNWRETYQSLFAGQELEEIAALTVGDVALWNEVDRGVLSYAAIIDSIVAKAPHLADKLRLAMDTIYTRVDPYPYAQAWVQEMKAKGLRAYVLSNYGKEPFERSLPRFSFMQHMDGGIISYQVGQIKPHRAIFDLLCKKYAFTPQESVFIDDNEANIQAAAKLGFHTILFQDKQQADVALQGLLGEKR